MIGHPLMKKLLSSLFVTLALLTTAQAVEPGHQAAIDKLFVLMQQQQQYESALTAGFEAGLGGALDQMPEAQRAKFEAAMKKVSEFMKTEMGWDKMKGEMSELYAKQLTQAEIEAVLPLMEKPEFQAFVSKQLKILPEATKLGAAKAQALQPQIMQMIQAEMSK